MWTKAVCGGVGVLTWLAMSYLLWVGLNFDGVAVTWPQASLFGLLCTLLALGMVALLALAINLADKLDLDGKPSEPKSWNISFCPKCGNDLRPGNICGCGYSREPWSGEVSVSLTGEVAPPSELGNVQNIDWGLITQRVDFCSTCGCMVIGEAVCDCGFPDTRRPTLRGEPN